MKTSINWIKVLNNAGNIITNLQYFDKSPLFKAIASIDFSGGAQIVSHREETDFSIIDVTPGDLLSSISMYQQQQQQQSTLNLTSSATLVTAPFGSSSSSSTSILDNPDIILNPGLQKIHQLGRSLTRRFPDEVLLGFLALISTELIQREVTKNVHTLPPIMRLLANRTVAELDLKLELLTSLQWNFQPFLQNEMENLQTQPIEIFDKYVTSEVLVKVDKDLSPFLSKLLADPKKTKEITKKLKEIVKLLTFLFIQPSASSSNRRRSPSSAAASYLQFLPRYILLPSLSPLTTSTTAAGGGGRSNGEKTSSAILENMEYLGDSIESAVTEWNRIIEDLGKLIKAESLMQYVAKMKEENSNASDATMLSNSTTMSSIDALVVEEEYDRAALIEKITELTSLLGLKGILDTSSLLPSQQQAASSATVHGGRGKEAVSLTSLLSFLRPQQVAESSMPIVLEEENKKESKDHHSETAAEEEAIDIVATSEPSPSIVKDDPLQQLFRIFKIKPPAYLVSSRQRTSDKVR